MEYRDFYYKVKELRVAQRSYIKEKNAFWRYRAITAAKEVDTMLQSIEDSGLFRMELPPHIDR